MHRNEQIVDMYRTGEFSLKKLGERFGLSHEGVRGILKRADVPINPVGLRVGYVSKFVHISHHIIQLRFFWIQFTLFFSSLFFLAFLNQVNRCSQGS